MDVWFPLARAVHFAACLLLLSVCVLDRFIAAGPPWRSAARLLIAMALAAALVSGLVWFAAVAVDMSGGSLADIHQSGALAAVWNQTSFGSVCKYRLFYWLAVTVVMPFAFFRARPFAWARWAAFLFSAALAASLAWAGHGRWNRISDVTHLLVAGCWPTGLLPFALLLNRLRKTPEELTNCLRLTRRFSAMSLAAALLLGLSGVTNAWVLVGSVTNLFSTSYGRLLLVKIAAYLLMLALGAMNLLRLKPRLPDGPGAAAALQVNVTIELLLALAVLVIVGFLGLMEPAVT